MSIFNDWIIETFLFGILSATMIFYNWVSAFINGSNITRPFSIFDLLFGLGITTYLIYIIPDESLQNIVLIIVAAIFGGIFTLLGVGWTIKKGDKDRKEEIQRIENDHREEERKKFVPYINISVGSMPSASVDGLVHNSLNFDDENDKLKCANKVFYSVSIKDFNVKNVSESNIIVKGIYIDNNYYRFKNTLLERNSICCIHTTGNWSITMPTSIKSIKLIVGDILGNDYSVDCYFSFDSDGRTIGLINDNDEEYTGFMGKYIVSQVSIPYLLRNENKKTGCSVV